MARPPLVLIYNGVEYLRVSPPPDESEPARGIEVVPKAEAAHLRGELDVMRESRNHWRDEAAMARGEFGA